MGASIELRREINVALAADLQSAARSHEILMDKIEVRLLAIDESLTHMSHLMVVQTSSKGGKFSRYLQKHLQRYMDTVEIDALDALKRRDALKELNDVSWNNEILAVLREIATAISEDLAEEQPSSLPAKGGPRPSQKRKRDGENGNEDSPSKVRRSRGSHLSAKAGASTSKSQEDASRIHDVGEAGEATSISTQALPRPNTGTAGAYATWIFRYEQKLDHVYKAWLHRQLQRAKCQTMDELEPLAELLVRFHKRVHPDHDWDNEQDVPVNPIEADYLDRHRPNVDRMFRMVHVPGAVDCQSYVVRHLYALNGKMHANADEIAYELIPLVYKKGLVHDWAAEEYMYKLTQPTATEATRIPLHGLPPPYAQGEWSYLTIVGEGGNGRASLYVKYGPNGAVIQRVIVKESFVNRNWNWPSYWYGNVSDRIPREAGLHRLLPTHKHIIEFLGYHVYKSLKMIRLYTAFAELGDLREAVFDNYRRDPQRRRGNQLRSRVPTIAILYFFEAMAAGVCLIAHGQLPHDDGTWPTDGSRGATPRRPWTHNLVHQDIKSSNYLLSKSDGSVTWPGLPVLKLCGFGNSFDISEPAYRNKSHPRNHGTPYLMAPEQVDTSRRPAILGPATNIFQIGLTILSLMSLSDPQFQPEFDTPHNLRLFRNDDFHELYPQDIVDLAQSCYRRIPSERPTPKALYLDIRKVAMEYPQGDHRVRKCLNP